MEAVAVLELAQFLAVDFLRVADVVERIGPVIVDAEIPMALELRPIMSGIRSAKLWRYPETGLPYVLRLEPSAETHRTIGDFVASFGSYEPSRMSREAPPTVIFARAVRGERWKVTAIATHAPVVDSVDDAALESISLRRDPLSVA